MGNDIQPSVVNGAGYWDDVWREESADQTALQQRNYRDTFAAIAMAVRTLGTVLDCGCGSGDLLRALQHANIVATGVDHSQEAVNRCRRAGLDAIRADLFQMKALPVYDAVVASQVLEHFDDAAAVLRALGAQARGVILVAVPHAILAPAVEGEHRRVFDADALRRTLFTVNGRVKVVAVEDWWLPTLLGAVADEGLTEQRWLEVTRALQDCHTERPRPWTEAESYVRFELARRLHPQGWRHRPIEAGRWLSAVCDWALASDRGLHLRADEHPLDFRRRMRKPAWSRCLDSAAEHGARQLTSRHI